MISWLQLIQWQDGLDIAVVAVLAWIAIRYLRRTRARTALLGLSLLGAIYAVASWLDLRLATALLQGFFAALVIVLVVVFQEDLRRFFEQLGSWRPGRSVAPDESDTISLLVRLVATLVEQRTGALIVLPRAEQIERHVDGGVVLNGQASEPLLLSIFDASSPGHDGAVVIRNGVIERFAVHLPLSTNREILGSRGTRHAAGLGLAERCDAVCIVVSEERGTISIGRDGELKTVALHELAAHLEAGSSAQAEEGVPPWRRGAWIDAGAAIAGAAIVWLIVVPGSDVSELVVRANIQVANLPDDLVLESVEPSELDVTLKGLRRDLILADPAAIQVSVDAYLARMGRRTFAVETSDVKLPDGISIVAITPEKVRLSMRRASESGESP